MDQGETDRDAIESLGDRSSRHGILWAASQAQEVQSQASFYSVNDLRLICVGEAKQVTLEVRWTSWKNRNLPQSTGESHGDDQRSCGNNTFGRWSDANQILPKAVTKQS